MADEFQEIIGIQFDKDEWKSGLTDMESQWNAFINRINSNEIKGDFSGASFSKITEQISNLATTVNGIKKQFADIFGPGEEAAVDATQVIKQQVEQAAGAAISSEKRQTEAVVTESAKRTEARTKEAKSWQALQKELKSAKSTRQARLEDAGRYSVVQDLGKQFDTIAAQRAKIEEQEQQMYAAEAQRRKAEEVSIHAPAWGATACPLTDEKDAGYA